MIYPFLIDSFLFIRCIETFSSTGEKIGRRKTMISRFLILSFPVLGVAPSHSNQSLHGRTQLIIRIGGGSDNGEGCA